MTHQRRLRSLYICYLSLSDPLVHTQVVAYLRGLAADGHTIHLLTFETERLTRSRRRRLRQEMAAQGIAWHGLRYHKRPSLPATAYDTLFGAGFAAALVVRHHIDTLHARTHVPAAMALIVRRLVPRRLSLIFDIRGLMAEEYEDAGRWKRDSLPFRLTKAVERAAINRAAGIVVLTERVRRQLFADGEPAGVFVIPCCCDVDAFGAARGERDRAREQLGLVDATVMVYVGKFGGWYMAGEMAEFFSVARELIPTLRFLILTQESPVPIHEQLDRRGIDDGYEITSAAPESVGAYLASADFGISFIRPTPSKASSSPTKVGEYLAAGLPVLSTAGVGDLDALLGDGIGVLVDEHDPAQYQTAARRMVELVAAHATHERCIATARRELSLEDVGIPRYRQLYDHVGRLSR